MKVHGIPADDSGCGAVRVVFPLAAASDAGLVDAVIAEPVLTRRDGFGELPAEINAGDAEVVVVHRPATRAMSDAIDELRREGRAVIVDIDDNLAAPHPDHLWARSPIISGAELAECCAKADLVTVSTPGLAGIYGPHGRVRVLRNAIPAALLALGRSSDQCTLGWAGAAAGHIGDLPATSGAVGQALAENPDWHFHVVGPGDDVRLQLELGRAPTATGALPVEEYHREIGSLDIGIVPLAPTVFNACKSWLKGLEYAARGVPFVAADTPEYQALFCAGAGLLAAGPRDWFAALRDLMRDESLRCEQAEQGREVAAAQTYEARSHEWCEALEQAILNRRECS